VSIGERLRAARERAGLTLEQAADLSGMSKAHLSRLESADRQPSIAALLALSDALRVPVSSLLGEDQGLRTIGLSDDQSPRYLSKGLSVAPCSGYAGGNQLEALRITVDPDRPASPSATHPGEEWLYVLSGILRLEYDGEFHHLSTGMSAHFDATRPHRLGAKDRPAELLLVATRDSRPVQTIH
jgi:transcriptional regulator with XRE-family HTH domain